LSIIKKRGMASTFQIVDEYGNKTYRKFCFKTIENICILKNENVEEAKFKTLF
jgi:catalase